MRLINDTPLRSSEIQELLDRVFDSKLYVPLDVRVRIRGQGSSALGATSPDRRHVNIGLSHPKDGYPDRHTYIGLAGAPTYEVWDWREEFVAIAAHEAEHVQGVADEMSCERACVAALRKYRRDHPLRARLVRVMVLVDWPIL